MNPRTVVIVAMLATEGLVVAGGLLYAVWGCRKREIWEQIDRNFRVVFLNLGLVLLNLGLVGVARVVEVVER